MLNGEENQYEIALKELIKSNNAEFCETNWMEEDEDGIIYVAVGIQNGDPSDLFRKWYKSKDERFSSKFNYKPIVAGFYEMRT